MAQIGTGITFNSTEIIIGLPIWVSSEFDPFVSKALETSAFESCLKQVYHSLCSLPVTERTSSHETSRLLIQYSILDIINKWNVGHLFLHNCFNSFTQKRSYACPFLLTEKPLGVTFILSNKINCPLNLHLDMQVRAVCGTTNLFAVPLTICMED